MGACFYPSSLIPHLAFLTANTIPVGAPVCTVVTSHSGRCFNSSSKSFNEPGDGGRWTGAVQLRVYQLSDHSLVKTVEVAVEVPGAAQIEWDGTNEMGFVMPRGLYGYNLSAWDTVMGSGGDGDVKTSNSLFIDAGTDDEGNPITEAEFAGYDDNGTLEDETDDNHLYYIRRYKLREVPVPLDNDGDGWENEDAVNGFDDDGDGAVDEDPEDYQPVRGASAGFIRLYDPDLQKVAEWTIPSLLCIEHGANDGLTTSVEGKQHSALVKVPVGLMAYAGEYRFVISARDSHADREKGHRQKWALERNQTLKRQQLMIAWQPMSGGQGYGSNPGNGVAGTDIGYRIHPDLLSPPSPLPSERLKCQRVKVTVWVNATPKNNRTIYLRLFDPDDPSSITGPIDAGDGGTYRPSDNRGVGNFVGGRAIVNDRWGRVSDIEVTTDQKGIATAIVELSGNPGDNFKVAAALDSATRDAMYVGQGSKRDALRVWVDDSGTDWKVPEGMNEPDTTPLTRATPLLTVWRRLHVEVDSMETVDPVGLDSDDLLQGDVPDPDTGALANAFRTAYITVKSDDTGEDNSSTPFESLLWLAQEKKEYCLTGNPNKNPPWIPQRGTRNEDTLWWSVYVCGVFEHHSDTVDNDQLVTSGNDELGALGTSSPTGEGEPEWSVIYMEVLRDLVEDEHHWDNATKQRVLQAVVLHEIGHQFELAHHGGAPTLCGLLPTMVMRSI